MGIEAYLDGGGWDRACSDADPDEVHELLLADPRRAWRVGVVEPERRKKLQDELGLSGGQLREWLRLGMRKSIAGLVARGEGVHGRAMLQIEGLLRQDMQNLRLELQTDHLFSWARGMAGLSSGRDMPPSSSAVMRLLVDGKTRPDRLGETPKDHPELLRAFRAALRAAVRDLCRQQASSSVLWACLVSVHITALRSDEDDSAGSNLLALARLPDGIVESMRQSLRGGDREAATCLSAFLAMQPDFEALLNEESFRDGCVRFGIQPDAELMRTEYAGLDPWVQFVVREVKAADPRMDGVRANWRKLDGKQRFTRSACLDLLDRADLLSFPSIERIVREELRRVRPVGTDASSGDRREFGEALFATAVGVRLTSDEEKTRETLMRVGGQALVDWELGAWGCYRDAPERTLAEDACKAVLRELRPQAMRADRRFEPLADRTQALQTQEAKDRDVDVLDAVGRGWLLRYVVDGLGAERTASELDAGLGILEDSDRGQITLWIGAARGRPDDVSWAREPMSRNVEMRIREAAAAVLRPRGLWRSQDESGLEALSRENMKAMLGNMEPKDQGHAAEALKDCLAAVQGEGPGPSPALLTAFRRGDATEFRRRLLGASVDLFVGAGHVSRWGPGGILSACACLVLLSWLLLEPLGFVARGAERNSPLDPPAKAGIDPDWRASPDGGFHYRMLDAPVVRALFPAATVSRELHESVGGRCTVEWPVAQELVLRLGARTESAWPEGVPGVGPWRGQAIELPGLSERAVIAKQLAIPERDIFVRNGVEVVGSHDRKACVVIIRASR